MSEVQSRPAAPRGRGSARGGRGGFSLRGRGGRGHATNGDKFQADADTTASIEDDGEVAQLKKKYGSNVGTIKEMFPDWTDEDIVFALQETNGDLEATVDRITDGSITQWGEVSKTKKDRSKSKVKEATPASLADNTNQTRVSRGGRAGFEGGRGGRGRGAERGRGGGRGGRGASVAHTNGSRKENNESLPPAGDSNAWESTPAVTDDSPTWETPKLAEPTPEPSTSAPQSTATAAVKAASSIIPEGVKKSWASMFAPAPAPKKEKTPEPQIEKFEEPAKIQEPVELPSKEPEVVESPPTPLKEIETPPVDEKSEQIEITPSKDELTETNLEQVLDTSAPAPTATAASTAASSWDPRNATNTSTPYSTTEQAPSQSTRPPPASGFQASALKATGPSGRSASYQRRVLDQEEAVRMPGNREVDRAAVQFGAFNLGAGDEDVDGEREEAETRAQPPQHSPIAPRASLPPAPQQGVAPVSETLPTPKQAPGLPAASQSTAAPGLPSPAPQSSAPGAGTQLQTSSQFGRYEQPAREQSSLQQKSYDAFGQQGQAQSPFDGFSNQPSQSQTQPPSGGFSSAPAEYSSYYTANEQQRQAYNNYYQQQYGTPGQQEGPGSQQRYGGYGPQSEGTSQFPQSGPQQGPSRYATAGEGQNSGHNTPNPTAQSQQQTGQSGQPQQPGHPQAQAGAYPYGNHPYYNSPYYAAYMNQYQQYGGNYNNPYGGKAGIHQQPYQGYGTPYDHSSSPAGGAFGGSSLHGRDSALSGGIGEYGRGGSAQSSNQQSIGAGGAFGGSHDTFGRNSGFQGQGGYNSQQANPQGSTDDLKPFADTKSASGPSPSLAHTGRPGSATNTPSGSGLPPPQSQQGGYGGYPHQGHGIHGNQGNSQYSGIGGAGGHQAGQGHQNSPYGGYGGFGGYGGGYGNSQQQRGGWGGNYGH